MILDGLKLLKGVGPGTRLAVFDAEGNLRPMDIDRDMFPQESLELGASGIIADTLVAETLLKSLGQLVVTGAGPHAIGGATDARYRLILRGTFISTGSDGALLRIAETLGMDSNASGALALIAGIINKSTSGTHPDFVGLQLEPPTIGAGAAALTNASTVKITGAPTGATNNYALWVDAGNVRLDSALLDLANASAVLRFGVTNQMGLEFNDASDYLAFSDSGAAERMRLTAGGILALGTTVVTGATAGDLVLANTKHVRLVNAAAASALSVLNLDVNNDILIGQGSGGGHRDIRLLPDTGGPAGVVLVGAAIRTGAAAGDLVLANAKGLRHVNGGGSTTIRTLDVDSGNSVRVGDGSANMLHIILNPGTTGDIQWGKALVALGGGAAPTFGTIGGSGPATAAQNTWMRVIDSGGAVFWVPAWK